MSRPLRVLENYLRTTIFIFALVQYENHSIPVINSIIIVLLNNNYVLHAV